MADKLWEVAAQGKNGTQSLIAMIQDGKLRWKVFTHAQQREKYDLHLPLVTVGSRECFLQDCCQVCHRHCIPLCRYSKNEIESRRATNICNKKITIAKVNHIRVCRTDERQCTKLFNRVIFPWVEDVFPHEGGAGRFVSNLVSLFV